LAEETAEKVAVLRSANMSVGVNLIAELLGEVAEALSDSGFDIEIIEKHHNQKTDAPSGTALMLAEAARRGAAREFVFDRTKKREKRGAGEIGFSVVRGGTIVGEHTVIFAGRDEVIEITHKASSKEIFAVGAIKAARFLSGKPPGLYSMSDVMKDRG
jgi:4-hydroxy-tetrahydrodipicolinate reductase